MNDLTKLILYPTLFIAGTYGLVSLFVNNVECGFFDDSQNSYNKCLIKIGDYKNKSNDKNFKKKIDDYILIL